MLSKSLMIGGGLGAVGSLAIYSRLNHTNGGILIHEFGHAMGLDHCPDASCIMNVNKSPASLLRKASIQFCSKCRGEIIEELKRAGVLDEKGSQTKKLHGLVCSYHYEGDEDAVAAVVEEELLEQLELSVCVETANVDGIAPSGGYGNLEPSQIWNRLTAKGIDPERYCWWRKPEKSKPSRARNVVRMPVPSTCHGLLCEVNNPITPWPEIWGQCVLGYQSVEYAWSNLTYSKYGTLPSGGMMIGGIALAKR